MKHSRLISVLALLLLVVALIPARSEAKINVVVDAIRPGGTCASPNPENGAFALHGWKLPAGGLTYRFNAASTPTGLSQSDAQNAITSAAAAWDGNTAATLLTFGGTTGLKAGKRDGVNAVSFGGAPFGAIAVAFIWTSNGTVLEADMTLANGFKWATNVGATDDCGGAADRMDVWDIATHEFGHWVGSAHTTTDAANNAQSMFPFASYKELFKRDIANGDKTALNTLYGP